MREADVRRGRAPKKLLGVLSCVEELIGNHDVGRFVSLSGCRPLARMNSTPSVSCRDVRRKFSSEGDTRWRRHAAQEGHALAQRAEALRREGSPNGSSLHFFTSVTPGIHTDRPPMIPIWLRCIFTPR